MLCALGHGGAFGGVVGLGSELALRLSQPVALLWQGEGGQPVPDTGGVSSAVSVNSVWDFVVKGGIMMIPIGLCSLVMLSIAIERLLVVRRGRVAPAGLWPAVRKALGARPFDQQAAVRACEASPSSLARVLRAGITHLAEPTETVEKRMVLAAETEIQTLRKNLRVLSVIAAIAPLLGLLGTIFGMITAFQTVAVKAEALGRTELLAGGIYEAMITTAAGLIVAIPALVFYHWISGRIDRLVREMDRAASEFVLDLGAGGGSGHSGGAARARLRPGSEPTPGQMEVSSGVGQRG